MAAKYCHISNSQTWTSDKANSLGKQTLRETMAGTANPEKAFKATSVFHSDWHEGAKKKITHRYDQLSVSWHVIQDEILKSVASANSVSYTPNDKQHYQDTMYMRYTLPALQVKKEFQDNVQIAWTPWSGHNIVDKAQLFGDLVELKPGVFDLQSQWYMKSDFYEPYRANCGNVDELTSWQTSLPKFSGDVPQPWPFCLDITQGLPLCQLDGVQFVYTFKPLTSLLRMRVKSDKMVDILAARSASGESKSDAKAAKGVVEDGWTLVKPDEYLHCITEPLIDISTRYTPEMHCAYTFTNPAEYNYWPKCSGDKGGWRSYEVPTYVHGASINPVGYGNKAEVKIDTKLPIRALHFTACNQKSISTNMFSNYTTNSQAGGQGVSPCSDYSLNCGDVKVASGKLCSHAQFITAWYRFPSCPKEAGHHAVAFVHKLPSIDHDVSISAKDGSHNLVVSIDDPTRSTDDPDTRFIVDAYALVIRKMDLVYNPKTSKWSVFFDKTNQDIEALRNDSQR